MVAVDMAAAEVSPGLLFFYHFFAVDAGKGQRVQPHGALGPRGVDLLPQGLNVFLSGRVEQAVCCSPQECGTAEVDERAILQDVGFTFYLYKARRKY